VSKYGVTLTALRDERCLIESLQELGYEVEVHPQGANLVGYEGAERPERANVIIRRRHLGPASNDIGFARTADGRLTALLSEYDWAIGYDWKWLGRVQQVYKEKQTLATARAKGYILKAREVIQTPEGQQVRLRFGVRG
jgi:hypothetical protein